LLRNSPIVEMTHFSYLIPNSRYLNKCLLLKSKGLLTARNRIKRTIENQSLTSEPKDHYELYASTMNQVRRNYEGVMEEKNQKAVMYCTKIAIQKIITPTSGYLLICSCRLISFPEFLFMMTRL